MDATQEMEAVYIYRTLTELGFMILQNHDRWDIWEPKGRFMPQQKRGLRSLRECSVWADGIDAARQMLILNRPPKASAKPREAAHD